MEQPTSQCKYTFQIKFMDIVLIDYIFSFVRQKQQSKKSVFKHVEFPERSVEFLR